jgi:hypothetical protein
MKMLLGSAGLFMALAMVTGTANAKVTDTKTKDCWLHVVAGKPGHYQEASSKKIEKDLTKDLCFSGTFKGKACDEAKKGCSKNPAVVGSYVSWGTSRENCSDKCAGHESESPKDLLPY